LATSCRATYRSDDDEGFFDKLKSAFPDADPRVGHGAGGQARRARDELFRGFEEVDHDGGLELAAYTSCRRAALGRVGAVDDVEEGGDRWRVPPAVRIEATVVGPPWESLCGRDRGRDRPGRAFGTGSHATTRLCLELLLDQRGSLLDVGCGRVLAIAAAKLGFDSVHAVDVDPQAIEATNAMEQRHRHGVGRRCPVIRFPPRSTR
jgi:hypothetical protein